jgi:Tfp pilus assembly protein PilN
MKAINLLPRDARRSFGTFRGVGFSTAALLGVLSVALAVVAAYVLLSNDVTSKRDQLNAVQAQQAAAARQVAALKPYADLESLRQSLLDRVKTLAGSRYDWPSTLARIARAFPANAGLTDLNASASADQGGSGPSVSLTGCTPSHDAVAGLIDRLRAVKGVAGVALQSSKLATDASGSSPSGAGAGACAGRPENFELTVSLEAPSGGSAAAPVPAAGQPGASTTPPAANSSPAPAAPTTTTPAAPAAGGAQ